MGQPQKIPFVLVNCDHGTIILPRLDYRALSETHNEFGVGTDILVHGRYDLDLISMTGGMLEARRQAHGPGCVALDCGANIGIYSIEWARQMTDWGMVIAFEPQERIYYALAGNIAINNLFNVKAFNKALGAHHKIVEMPLPDYQLPAQFGGLSLKGDRDIGQVITAKAPVEVLPIDSLGLKRVDFIKIDVEGMEPDVLAGAWATIASNKPYILAEWTICGKESIEGPLKRAGYDTITIGMNLVCAPKGDPVIDRLRGMFEAAA